MTALRKEIDRYTTAEVYKILEDAHADLGTIAQELFGAKTMTKATRLALAQRINGSRTKMRTAIMKIENA